MITFTPDEFLDLTGVHYLGIRAAPRSLTTVTLCGIVITIEEFLSKQMVVRSISRVTCKACLHKYKEHKDDDHHLRK